METQYDSAYYYFTKAENASLKIKDEKLSGYIKISKADILSYKYDYLGAEKLAIQALKTGVIQENNLLIYNSYLTLGNSLVGLNNYNKALEYYNKAIEVSESLNTHPKYLSFKCQPYNNIATIYLKNGNYEEVTKLTKRGLDIADFKKSEPTIYCYLINKLAYSQFKLGNKYSFKKFEETLKIGDSIGSIPIVITSMAYLGEYYLDKKDTLQSNYYLKSAQIQAHNNNVFEDELAILKLLALANPKKQSYFNNKYINLNDSLQNIERISRDKYSRIEFETDLIIQEKNEAEYKKMISLINFLFMLL